jgi:hypothetical protein
MYYCENYLSKTIQIPSKTHTGSGFGDDDGFGFGDSELYELSDDSDEEIMITDPRTGHPRKVRRGDRQEW